MEHPEHKEHRALPVCRDHRDHRDQLVSQANADCAEKLVRKVRTGLQDHGENLDRQALRDRRETPAKQD